MDKPEDALRDAVSEIDLMVSDFVSRYVRELVAARVSETVSALRETVTTALPVGEPEPNGNGSEITRAEAARVLGKEFRKRGNVYGDLTRLERKGLIRAHGKGRGKTIDLDEAREAMRTLPSR